MSIAYVRHPIAQSFVDRVFQSLAAGFDPDDFSAEQPHAENVQRLPPHVFSAHVNHALQTRPGANRRCRHSVLTGSGFSDDAAFAHSPGQQNLSERVVDFVSARVIQVFSLQVNLRAAQMSGQTFGKSNRRRPPDEFAQQTMKFLLKRRIVFCDSIRALQFVQRVHQSFRDEAAAVRSEVAA